MKEKQKQNGQWASDPSEFGSNPPLQTPVIIGANDVEAYLKHHHQFRYNKITGLVQVWNRKTKSWDPLTDRQFNTIYQNIKKAGGKTTEKNLRSIIHSEFTPEYDPFVSYFTLLPNIDPNRDYIQELADQVVTTDQVWWSYCLKKWLVACVVCALEEDVVNQTVLILVGNQGDGKSTFLERLLPPALKGYSYNGPLKPDEKDSIIHLAECFLVNMDELESLTKFKEAAMKYIITLKNIRIRRPYGSYAENMIRRASLTGSVNNHQFLSDSTGSRRFLIHETTSINYQHTVDMDKVWKQAYDLYKAGFQFYFDHTEIKTINTHNESYELINPIEELLLEYFEPVAANHITAKKITATEMLKIMHKGRLPSNSKGEAIKLGLALKRHGFTCEKTGKTKKYIVNQINNNGPYDY